MGAEAQTDTKAATKEAEHSDSTGQFTAEQKELLSRVQSHFPIIADPYAELGQQMGIGADKAYEIMQSLRDGGYVRRMGPVFDSYKLGYVSTLCAVSVPEAHIEEVAEFINSFFNVTHNYLRENTYNIWFTVIAYGKEELQRIIRLIEDFAQTDVLQLPALRLFKIKVDFNVKGEARAAERRKATVPGTVVPTQISSDDKALIRVAQASDFSGRYPYKVLADEVSQGLGKTVTEQYLVDTLLSWKNNGTIRRFGLTLRHHKVGFKYNVMVVWDVPEHEVEQAGSIMALQDEVSHCYERPRVKDWQSNLYTMIHGQSREECNEAIAAIQNALEVEGIKVKQPQQLFTLRELKKKSMQYFCEE